jgi:uncharacterized protein YggE
MSSYAQTHAPNAARSEGVTVVGEAVRRVTPDSAELLLEITATAATAGQAVRDNQAKTAQVAQAVAGLGVQASDLQPISQNVCNLYSPMPPALPGFGPPLISQGSFTPFASPAGGMQPDIQFGSYHVRHTVRVNVRDPARVGEIVDSAARAGAVIVGGFSFKSSDEASAQRAALEAAGKNARAKAETLAAAAGKQLGEPVAISEDIVVSNGAYAALRSAVPFAFGAGAPQVVGELEYYARVSANFRFV